MSCWCVLFDFAGQWSWWSNGWLQSRWQN